LPAWRGKPALHMLQKRAKRMEYLRTVGADDYVMLSTEQDREAAHRWKMANGIRKSGGGAKTHILEYLRENVGKSVSGDELRYVTGNKKEWARRVRELRTEEGWPISTYWNGRPELKSGLYMLEEDRQMHVHDRTIPDDVRRRVLVCDSYTCQAEGCGWNRSQWVQEDPRHLELHHIEHHVRGGGQTKTITSSRSAIAAMTTHTENSTHY